MILTICGVLAALYILVLVVIGIFFDDGRWL